MIRPKWDFVQHLDALSYIRAISSFVHMKNLLIKKYGEEKRWVNWKLQTRGGKQTKIPYSALTGKMASSTDPKTWTTAKEALTKSDNIGIILHDKKLICIDIDHVIENKKIVGEEKEKIAELILEADTYTEISQSGTGLHLFFESEQPITIKHNKKAPFEVYSTGRYIAVTGTTYGSNKPVRTVSLEQALAIIELAIPQSEEIVQSEQKDNKEQSSTSYFKDDTTLLERMFASKNGEKIKRLCEGDLSDYKNDSSTGDMALCSHLAFWSGKDAVQIERIWLASPLGQRKKTVERADYRSRTITNAIKKCKEVYEPPEASKLDLLYATDDKGKRTYINNTENIYRVLRDHKNFIGRFRYDEFKITFELDGRPWDTTDIIQIQTEISVLFPPFTKVTKGMVEDAMFKIAKECKYDSAKHYVTSIVWDKKARLDTWLSSVYGVENDEYHRAVASNWMKGLVKRIIEPGCKFDYVLVLEGEQGVKKSTSLAILGGEWHVETTMSTDNKDFFMQFSGKTIIEFSEGETLSRTEVKRMKAIITNQVDRYRVPYERMTQDFPRRCVFAMTTNQTEYLKDETGNRRWLPVKVVKEEADVEWLKENRDQLYAEAYHRAIVLKENAYEFPKEATLEAQMARMIHDPNEDLIVDWYHNELKIYEREKNGITIHMAYSQAIHRNNPAKPLDRYHEMMISEVFRNNLNLEKRRIREGGALVNKYFPKVMSTPSELQEKLAEENNSLF